MASKGQTRGSTLLALAIGLLPQAPLAPVAMAQNPATQSPAASPAIDSSIGKLGIGVAPVILAEPEVETSVRIQVGPEAAVPRQTFLRVRGMPLAAKLSDGHVVSPGVWAVPLAALPTLRLLAPLSSSGRTEIQLSLVGVDGGVLAETKSSLVVAPAWLLGSNGQRQDVTRAVPQVRPEVAEARPQIAPPATATTLVEARTLPAAVEQPRAPAIAPPPPPVAAAPVAVAPVAPLPQPAARPEQQAPVVAALPPAAAPVRPAPPAPPPPVAAPMTKAPPQLTAADRERAESMVQRGDTFWRQGNFAAARQFFRRAADMGLAAGALRMGATFDPVEIASITVVGLKADPKEASVWYERARELGAPEAGPRLSRIQAR